jgi:hypothetical protein
MYVVGVVYVCNNISFDPHTYKVRTVHKYPFWLVYVRIPLTISLTGSINDGNGLHRFFLLDLGTHMGPNTSDEHSLKLQTDVSSVHDIHQFRNVLVVGTVAKSSIHTSSYTF